MVKTLIIKSVSPFIVVGCLFLNLACNQDKTSKITITTSSDEALNYYLQGRELVEKLRLGDAAQYFEQAVSADDNFALGYLNLALVSGNTEGSFENLKKAKALIDHVSEGERLWILGVEAGMNGFLQRQMEYYQKLVSIYPDDERAHVLLGSNYFNQQQFEKAVAEYEQATKIAPQFSSPYNSLGYLYRFLGDYTKAAAAFEKYIELIPTDPNPYDSYAELLLKMGKYQESIEYYQKALSQDPHFLNSYIGIATNLNYLDEHSKAREWLTKLLDIARDNSERRAALFAMVVSYVDQGLPKKALVELEKRLDIARQNNDVVAMTVDLNIMGNILVETGQYDAALEKYTQANELVESSTLAEKTKDLNRRTYIYNKARVAIGKKDIVTAKNKLDEFREWVQQVHNPIQSMLIHELAAIIALEEGKYDLALKELQQSNPQNPLNLYRIAKVYEVLGEENKAQEYYTRTEGFNGLNSINMAFVHMKMRKEMP